MAFTSSNEITISGGSESDRRQAFAMLLAADWGLEPATEDDIETLEGGALRLRFDSLDALPEDEIRNIAPQFPDLDFLLLYLSLDGEFFGFLRARGAESAEESADFPEGELERIEKSEEAAPLSYVRRHYEGNPAIRLG